MNEQVGVYTKIFRNEKSMQCMIDSVLLQTFKDFRFYIVVNNETVNVVKKYTTNDNRVTIILSETDNDDLQNYYLMISERHKYLFSIDGDDWLDYFCLEKMVSFANKNNLDITICGNYFYSNGDNIGVRCITTECCLEKYQVLNNINNFYMYMRTFWGKLWKCDVLKKLDYFPTSLEYGGYGGDTIECFCILDKSQNVGFMNECLYYYRINPKSISYSIKPGRLKSDDAVYKYVYGILEKNDCITYDIVTFLNIIFKNATYDSIELVKSVSGFSVQEKVNSYMELLNTDTMSNLISVTTFADLRYVVFCGIFDGISISNISEYYPVFCTIFKEYNDMISEKLYYIFLYDKKLLENMINNNRNNVANILFDYLSKDIDCKKDILYLLRKMSDSVLFKFVSNNFDFSLKYLLLIEQIYRSENEKSLSLCYEYIEKCEHDEFYSFLLELYINLAAYIENAECFIEGKLKLLDYFIENGKKNEAHDLYIDLCEMQISKEILEKYKNYCVNGGS